MLQLFGSGLISLWLEMAGVPTKPVDVLDVFTSNSRPGLVLAPDPSPLAANTVQQYLQQLEAAGLTKNHQGIWLQSGFVLLAENQGTMPLPAASITKVATSLAALKTWGANHQFETLVGATGPIRNGVLQGDLIVHGGGDPFFVWEEAIALGNSLNRMGIKRITGNLVIAGNFAMNYKTNPLIAGQLLQQAMNATTWSNAARVQYQAMPPKTPRPQVAIAGTVQVTALPNPKQILLVRHRSLPLAEILKEMNIYSNNEMSEMLAQNLGGAAVVQAIAAATAGVPPQEIQLVNGSGLGVENRISARAACAMLMAIQRELLSAQLSVADLFPMSGRDRRGTLEARRIPQAAVVKTGTLRDVSALAGVMPTRDRGLVWFAIVNRGTNVEGLRSRQDQLLQSLLKQWQVTATVPAAITPKSSHNAPIPLGAASRNEILYGG